MAVVTRGHCKIERPGHRTGEGPVTGAAQDPLSGPLHSARAGPGEQPVHGPAALPPAAGTRGYGRRGHGVAAPVKLGDTVPHRGFARSQLSLSSSGCSEGSRPLKAVPEARSGPGWTCQGCPRWLCPAGAEVPPKTPR